MASQGLCWGRVGGMMSQNCGPHWLVGIWWPNFPTASHGQPPLALGDLHHPTAGVRRGVSVAQLGFEQWRGGGGDGGGVRVCYQHVGRGCVPWTLTEASAIIGQAGRQSGSFWWLLGGLMVSVGDWPHLSQCQLLGGTFW